MNNYLRILIFILGFLTGILFYYYIWLRKILPWLFILGSSNGTRLEASYNEEESKEVNYDYKIKIQEEGEEQEK